jgi:uncharacterized membrane protein YebE (DUF533 family)
VIAAAKASGHIDDERKKISDKLALSGIGSEAEEFLSEELAKPSNLDELVAAAETDARRLNSAPLPGLQVTSDTRAERGYLDLLAGRLNLPDTLVDHIRSDHRAGRIGAGGSECSAESGWNQITLVIQ